MFWECFRDVLEMFKSVLGTCLECFGIVLELFWNVFGMFLEYFYCVFANGPPGQAFHQNPEHEEY